MTAVADAAIGVAIGKEMRTEVLKTAKPIFDSLGKLTVAVITAIPNMIKDKLGHSHYLNVIEYSGVDIVIDEIATDLLARRIRLTVLWSPEDKMTNKTFESKGYSASSARNSCLSCIEALAKYYYKV